MGYYGWTTWDLDEESDPKYYKVWIFDGKESIPINKPFDLWRLIAVATQPAMQYGANMLSVPTTRGFEWRVKDAFIYITVDETTEEERRQREPIFREKITPWIEDFETEWRRKAIPEMMGYAEQLKKVNVAKLNDIELREHFEQWMSVSEIVWKKGHWYPFYAAFSIYLLFEGLCKELLGIDDKHPQYKAIMSGFDNRLYQTDRKLWMLADRVKELGLENALQAIEDDEELLSKFRGSEAGRKWLQELEESLSEDGWRCAGHPATVSTPSWIEKPSLALPHIRQAIAKGGLFVLDRERERLVKEREEVEKDLLSRVPADKRGWFEKLMKATQWQGRWTEEHHFYCENLFNAIGRHITKEIGNRFARAGAIEDPEDIYFFVAEEMRVHLIGKDRFDGRQLFRIRKQEYEDYVKAEPPPPFFGDPNEIARFFDVDPIMRVPATAPIVKPELKADLYGTASAPGVVEGIARVIFSEDQFAEVQPGDILVAPVTSPSWTPLFGIAKAAVTDYGGSMSHSVVVGREYRIPVVAGTLEGTRKIKTGDRIRVDGNTGAVYILR
jgi:phosphohistidine swiveling domain-containing protein